MKSFKILSLITLLLFILSCAESKDFNSTEWKNWVESESSLNTRWIMHKDLLNSYNLKNYNKDQILNLLGKPNSEIKNKYYYNLGYVGSGINTGTMVITFQNDSVVNIEVTKG